jgi:Signal transduction histidine kinase, glucose-6-phosphate specific
MIDRPSLAARRPPLSPRTNRVSLAASAKGKIGRAAAYADKTRVMAEAAARHHGKTSKQVKRAMSQLIKAEEDFARVMAAAMQKKEAAAEKLQSAVRRHLAVVAEKKKAAAKVLQSAMRRYLATRARVGQLAAAALDPRATQCLWSIVNAMATARDLRTAARIARSWRVVAERELALRLLSIPADYNLTSCLRADFFGSFLGAEIKPLLQAEAKQFANQLLEELATSPQSVSGGASVLREMEQRSGPRPQLLRFLKSVLRVADPPKEP